MPDVLSDFAAPAEAGDRAPVTYTDTHATVKDGNVSMRGVTRDSDGVPFVAVTRKGNDGKDGKTRYHRADAVARYLQLLAQK